MDKQNWVTFVLEQLIYAAIRRTLASDPASVLRDALGHRVFYIEYPNPSEL